jgi:hypothetical protein
MKPPFLAVAGLLVAAGVALADPERNLVNLKILQTPTLSAEELQQVLFAASFDRTYPAPIKLELHNPFRDKSLRGIVVRVQSKSPDGKEQTLEMFGDLQCGPLQTTEFQMPLFNWEELLKGSPVITLKEVHRETEAEQEQTFRDLKTLASPAFPVEQLKQVLFTGKLGPDHVSGPIQIAIYNPFRDRSIGGIVLLVQFKLAGGKAQSMEIFADLDCGPLQSEELRVPMFNLEGLAKDEPVTITLKEVHRQTEPEPAK